MKLVKALLVPMAFCVATANAMSWPNMETVKNTVKKNIGVVVGAVKAQALETYKNHPDAVKIGVFCAAFLGLGLAWNYVFSATPEQESAPKNDANEKNIEQPKVETQAVTPEDAFAEAQAAVEAAEKKLSELKVAVEQENKKAKNIWEHCGSTFDQDCEQITKEVADNIQKLEKEITAAEAELQNAIQKRYELRNFFGKSWENTKSAGSWAYNNKFRLGLAAVAVGIAADCAYSYARGTESTYTKQGANYMLGQGKNLLNWCGGVYNSGKEKWFGKATVSTSVDVAPKSNELEDSTHYSSKEEHNLAKQLSYTVKNHQEVSEKYADILNKSEDQRILNLGIQYDLEQKLKDTESRLKFEIKRADREIENHRKTKEESGLLARIFKTWSW